MKYPLGCAIASVLAVVVTLQSLILNYPLRTDAATLETSSEGRMLDQVSSSIRSTLASALYLRTDEYMHLGDPVKQVVRDKGKIVREQDLGTSWRYNREIVTLLKFATVLDPAFTEAQTLLGLHLARDRNQSREGLRHLQRALLYNQRHPRLYMLYGQIGEIYYDAKLFAQSKNYLERAIAVYPRVRDEALLNTPAFEDTDDDRRLRSYRAYLASSYFELRDWKNCYKWYRDHGEFAPTNRITRWMQIWQENQDAAFRPEEYPAEDRVPKTEMNRQPGEDISWEQGKHPEMKLTADFEKEFYEKLGFLFCVVLGLFGTVLFRDLW